MKKILFIFSLCFSLAACQRDIRRCDCELDFTIITEITENGSEKTASPSWEIESKNGDSSNNRAGIHSKKHSESFQWEKKRSVPFSKEEQKSLAEIALSYEKECLLLCQDPNLSENEFRREIRKLNEQTEQQVHNILHPEQNSSHHQDSAQTKSLKIETLVSCLSEDDIQWEANILAFQYDCPIPAPNFRLIATAFLSTGTKETNPNFLEAEIDPYTNRLQFDLSKLNWTYLSQQEQTGLILIEARISIPVKAGSEKTVANISF